MEKTPEKTLDIRQWMAAAAVVLAVVGYAGTDRPARQDRLPVAEVSVEAAEAMLAAGAIMIDVRAGAGAHVPGALQIPLEDLAARMSELEHARNRPIVVYCGEGSRRGPDAVALLNKAGFYDVVNLAPGFSGWKEAGRPVTGA